VADAAVTAPAAMQHEALGFGSYRLT